MSQNKYNIKKDDVFSFLTVIGKTSNGEGTWDLLCVCGNTKKASGRVLAKGILKSCGCKRLEGNLKNKEKQIVLYKGTPLPFNRFK